MKLGDVVKWKSQANGRTKEKTGVIVGVVPAGRRMGLLRYLADVETADEARAKYSTGSVVGCGMSRDHESYLVAVKTGKTDSAKLTIYWPRVSALRPATP